MRQFTPKRQKHNRAVQPIRDQFADDFPECMVCRGNRQAYTHEISQGPARRLSLGERCALLRLCEQCHRWVHAEWSIEEQLALKGLRDPEYYDRVHVNQLRGKAPDAIDEGEVWEALSTVMGRIR